MKAIFLLLPCMFANLASGVVCSLETFDSGIFEIYAWAPQTSGIMDYSLSIMNYGTLVYDSSMRGNAPPVLLAHGTWSSNRPYIVNNEATFYIRGIPTALDAAVNRWWCCDPAVYINNVSPYSDTIPVVSMNQTVTIKDTMSVFGTWHIEKKEDDSTKMINIFRGPVEINYSFTEPGQYIISHVGYGYQDSYGVCEGLYWPISFKVNVIPEPGILGLFAIGSMILFKKKFSFKK